MKHEDYVALYTASPYILPRKNVLGIGTTVLLCAVLVLPMPSTWRAFSGTDSILTSDGEAYLAADPHAQEQGVTHESNFKVQENYDDYDIPSYLFAGNNEDADDAAGDNDANLTASTDDGTEDGKTEGNLDTTREQELATHDSSSSSSSSSSAIASSSSSSISTEVAPATSAPDTQTASTSDSLETKSDDSSELIASHAGEAQTTTSDVSTTDSSAQTELAANTKEEKDTQTSSIATIDTKSPQDSTLASSSTTSSTTSTPVGDKDQDAGDQLLATTGQDKDTLSPATSVDSKTTASDTKPSDTTSSGLEPSLGKSDTLLAQNQSQDTTTITGGSETTAPATAKDNETELAANDSKAQDVTTTGDSQTAQNTGKADSVDKAGVDAGVNTGASTDEGELLAAAKPTKLTEPEPEPIAEVRPDGKWYKHTIKSGDNLSGIFTHLNLPYATLNRITKVASKKDLRLDVGDPIFFLVDEDNVVKEVVKNSSKTQQVRFSRLTGDDDFKVVYEPLNAHMSEQALAQVNNAEQMPLAIEAQKSREARAAERKAREAKLLAERQAKEEQERQAKLLAAAKAKEEREAKETQRKARAEERKAAAERKEALAANSQKAKDAREKAQEQALEHNVTTARPRLIINSIASGESFAKAAQRAGLTPREIATIKRIFRKQIDVNKLRKGDKFRVLFTGVSSSSLISAVQLQTSRGNFESFMNPEDRNYYGENEFTPTAGVFRRFPLSGSIQVNSQFDPQRRHPVTRRISPHNGVDFKAKIGTPVYAPADGVVSFAGYQRAAGYYIIVRHANNYSTVYMHLSKTEVKRDQKVRVGQVIARTGNTGRTTGPHLHYEVRINDHPVNPLKIELPNSNQTNLAREQREAFANNVKILRAELRNDRLALHRPM